MLIFYGLLFLFSQIHRKEVKTMRKFILFILALFPICYVVDLLSDSSWFMNYTRFIGDWWDVILVIILCIIVITKNTGFKYDMLDEMRVRQFYSEFRRYNDTPYLPPILVMYMQSPPGSVHPSDYAYVNDPFYSIVANSFRDRVYVLQDFDSLESQSRAPYLEVIGAKNLSKCGFYFIIPFAWILFVHIELEQSLLFDWPLLTLPFMFAFFLRGFYCVEAFIKYNPRKLDQLLKESGCNELVTWREAFPDKEVGITFIRAYYAEMERRQRYEYIIRNQPVPEQITVWNNPNFAPFPYPSKNIPSWESEYEPLFTSKKQELEAVNQLTIAQKIQKNVVSFPRKK